jgi:hypothetical protein
MDPDRVYITQSGANVIATAVWSAVATANDEPGTMGAKLNDAGGASNPWTEVLESGLTAADMMRLLTAVMAGKMTVSPAGVVEFESVDGAKSRVTVTLDAAGNRTLVVLDAT